MMFGVNDVLLVHQKPHADQYIPKLMISYIRFAQDVRPHYKSTFSYMHSLVLSSSTQLAAVISYFSMFLPSIAFHTGTPPPLLLCIRKVYTSPSRHMGAFN